MAQQMNLLVERESRRQIHSVPKITPAQMLGAALVQIQILCARGASLERIWQIAELGIVKSNFRH